MNKESLIYKFISVFIWSLYPVFIALGSSETAMAWFVVIVHVSAALGASVFGFYSLRPDHRGAIGRRLGRQVRNLAMEQWGFVILAGVCSTLYNLCFLYAMILTSKAGVAVIIETAPVIAMLLTSLIVQKQWDKLGWKHAVVSGLILYGVILIVVADQKDAMMLFTDFNAYMQTQDYVSLIGCGIALLGSIMSALSDLMRAQVGNMTRHLIRQSEVRYDRDLSGVMLGEAFVRILAVPIAFVVLMMFWDVSEFSLNDSIYAFLAGFLIFNLGSITYAMSLLKSSNPAIALLDYLSPPLSIMMLVALGLSGLHIYVVIGTVLIIAGNAVFVFEKKRPKINHP